MGNKKHLATGKEINMIVTSAVEKDTKTNNKYKAKDTDEYESDDELDNSILKTYDYRGL